MFIQCCNSAGGVTGELQFNKRVPIFNIHLVRCYLSSRASTEGWRRRWYVKRSDEKTSQGKRGVVRNLMRCWFMVRILDPCSCHFPSGLLLLPPSRPTPALPPACATAQKPAFSTSSPNSAMSVPSCAPSPGWIQNPGAGSHEGSTLPYFQERVQTYMPSCAMRSASYRLLGYPFSSRQSGPRSTLPEPNYGGVTSLSSGGGWKSASSRWRSYCVFFFNYPVAKILYQHSEYMSYYLLLVALWIWTYSAVVLIMSCSGWGQQPSA